MIAEKNYTYVSQIDKLRKRCRTGSRCVFIRLSENIGLKLYKDESNATRTVERQTKAFKHGLGPKVLSGVKAYRMKRRGKFRTFYGYKTQIVKLCRREYDNEELGHKMDQLISNLEDIGLPSYDVCWFNCGWIGDKLVCIDFDDVSMDNFG